jgi:hypothetical protein
VGSNETDQNRLGIANFAALKTAIANGEEPLVKSMLGDLSMLELEKSYLIDLAQLSDNLAIIKLLEDIPVTK